MRWQQSLLAFWFGELTPEQWFKSDPAVDAQLRERFLPDYEAVRNRFLIESAIATAERALAYTIMLDQFPRNVFRGTPRAFEADALALSLADAAVGAGLDGDLPAGQRVFIYLPFEHSERLVDQQRSVALFTALGISDYTKYAVAHHEIIARFGRFPHRNAILGRSSTPEEIAFLGTPGSSF